jgi:hypothetical protein
MALTFAEARSILTEEQLSGDSVFEILAAIGRHGSSESRDEARDLLIRVLDRQEEVPSGQIDLLQGLIRIHGLFPYMENVDELPIQDQLAYEAHRPYPEIHGDVVLHAEQAMVYERLLEGENVVLSAPTSFGKSLVIDAVLAARNFRNVAIVVPTLALMDETRRRLSRLSSDYKIITHGTQVPGDRNLYVMTQERLLDMGDLPQFEFFAIDEFYKLDPAHSDERSNRLNLLLRRLLEMDAQFYLLGPNITELASGAADRLRATFIGTGFTTVATDVERISATEAELPDALAAVLREVGSGTLIYCRSPKRSREVARWLIERGIHGGNNLDSAADWIGDTYHPDWIVGEALRQGIGIHHGSIPRALGHHIVRLFNEGRLPYLIVTSTLIEGVNTTARNVVVLDNKVGNKKYDYFTYSNIRGRSGRMFQHFLGRVVVFNPEPRRSDLVVDVPVLSQPSDTSLEILIQLPPDELTPENAERLKPILEQSIVSVETVRKNAGLSPIRQLDAAQQMAEAPSRWSESLSWRGAFPSTSQMRDLAELLFALTRGGSAVKTAAQLGARVNILRRQRGNVRALAEDQIESRGVMPDIAVEDALDFQRNWAQFRIPAALTALGNLADDVLSKAGRPHSDTRVFAGALENLFLPPYVTVLEEYGLPTQVGLKLEPILRLQDASGLDDVLSTLRRIDASGHDLTPFEREMLDDTQAGL